MVELKQRTRQFWAAAPSLCYAIVVIKVTACLLQLHMHGVWAESDLNITLKYLFEPGLSWFSGIENQLVPSVQTYLWKNKLLNLWILLPAFMLFSAIAKRCLILVHLQPTFLLLKYCDTYLYWELKWSTLRYEILALSPSPTATTSCTTLKWNFTINSFLLQLSNSKRLLGEIKKVN